MTTLRHAPASIRDRASGTQARGYRLSSFEFRADSGAKSWRFTGCASVFDVGYPVYGGPERGGWTEIIHAGACDASLRANPDVQLLVNHRDMPLARTKSGTLRLSADRVGLHVDADLDPTDPDVQRLAPKLRRRDVDEMSFAFDVTGQDWANDYTERHIYAVDIHKGDVSIVNFGANDSTWAGNLRNRSTGTRPTAPVTLTAAQSRAAERLGLDPTVVAREAAGWTR